MDYEYWAELIEKHVPGLMAQSEVRFLMQCVRSAPPNTQYVDLGTYLGKSTAAICAAAKGVAPKVITIDTFKYIGRLGPSNPSIVRANLAQLKLEANILVASSGHIPTTIDKVGFLFIDTQHTGGRVNGELDIWLPHITARGVVALHDYIHNIYPSYAVAIDKRFRGKWEFLGLQGSTICFRRP